MAGGEKSASGKPSGRRGRTAPQGETAIRSTQPGSRLRGMASPAGKTEKPELTGRACANARRTGGHDAFQCALYWRRRELTEMWTASRRDMMDALTQHSEHHCRAL